ERVARGVGVALAKCLRQALEQGRVTAGIWASAMLLQRDPERVLVCLLPDMDCVNDHALQIHHTLITAFCWEHGIRLLRVAGPDLKRALGKLPPEGTRNIRDVIDAGVVSPCVNGSGSSDFSCVLIQASDEGMNFEEEVVSDYHDDVMNSDVFPKPVLHLPG
ncbi:hypothetical protein BaRGS_00006577, partial [Batillaria attramentaria]